MVETIGEASARCGSARDVQKLLHDRTPAGELEEAFMAIFSKFDIDFLKTYNAITCTSFLKGIVYADKTDFALGRRTY